MANTNVFALRNSGLEAFLFAEVGTEANGSGLTVLSVLARLGQDPWSEAARWTNLPRAAAIDDLAGDIARMSSLPQALIDTRAIAARLIALLPVQSRLVRPGAVNAAPARRLDGSDAPPQRSGTSRMALYAAMAFGMILNLILMSEMSRTAAPTPVATTPAAATSVALARPATPPVPPAL